jgi:hypothetical protein
MPVENQFLEQTKSVPRNEMKEYAYLINSPLLRRAKGESITTHVSIDKIQTQFSLQRVELK